MEQAIYRIAELKGLKQLPEPQAKGKSRGKHAKKLRVGKIVNIAEI